MYIYPFFSVSSSCVTKIYDGVSLSCNLVLSCNCSCCDCHLVIWGLSERVPVEHCCAINTNTHPEQRKLRVTLSLSHNRLGHVYFSKSLFLPLITQNFPIFHGKKSVGHSGIGCLILGKKRWGEFVMELISSLAGFAATAQIRFFHLCDTDLISSLLSKQ